MNPELSDKALTVGVVVPVLNEASLIAGSIAQWHALHADELVFVDGESSDDSRSILAEAGFFCITEKPGRARQMNAGSIIIKSDIIIFLHTDTTLTSSNILEVKNAMQAADVVGGRFDIRLSGRHPAFRIIEFFVNVRSRITGIATGDQCLFVQREVFERLGRFADLPLMEDVAFSKRLKSVGKIACLRQKVTTSSRRWEQHGILKTIVLMWKLRFLYWLGVPSAKLAAMYRQAR